MRVIILEDELISREKIEEFLYRYDDSYNIVLSTDRFDRVLNFLINNQADLILSDIQVTDGNVFDNLKKHPITCPFIFITAFDNYAFKALENYGMGYLLKPYTYKEFVKIMDRFKKLNKKLLPDISALTNAIKKENHLERVIVHSNNKAKILKVEHIAYIKIDDGVLFIYTHDNDKYMLRKTMTLLDLENSLDSTMFFRINKSQIISLSAIKHFESYGKNRIAIKLNNSKESFVTSISRTPDFRKWIDY